MARPYLTLHLDHFEDPRRLGDPEVVAAEIALLVATKQAESDGRLAGSVAARALAGVVDDPGAALKALEAAELCVRESDGSVLLSDWRSFMKSREEVEAYRAQQAAFGRAGQASRRGKSQGGPRGKTQGRPRPPRGSLGRDASTPDLTGPDTDLTGPESVVESDESSSTTRGGGLLDAMLSTNGDSPEERRAAVEAARWAGAAE